MSNVSTPVSTASTSSSTESDSSSLAEEIKKYNTEEFINFLRSCVELGLDEEDLSILRDQKIDGLSFFRVTEKKYLDYGLKGGPIIKLLDFAKECKTKKLKAFSSYKCTEDLEKVFSRYGVPDTKNFPTFIPQSVKIDDNDEELELCIKVIKNKMRTIGTAAISNEAVRCEYI